MQQWNEIHYVNNGSTDEDFIVEGAVIMSRPLL